MWAIRSVQDLLCTITEKVWSESKSCHSKLSGRKGERENTPHPLSSNSAPCSIKYWDNHQSSLGLVSCSDSHFSSCTSSSFPSTTATTSRDASQSVSLTESICTWHKRGGLGTCIINQSACIEAQEHVWSITQRAPARSGSDGAEISRRSTESAGNALWQEIWRNLMKQAGMTGFKRGS